MTDFQASVVLPTDRDQSFHYLQRPTNFLKLFPADITSNVDIKLPELLSPGAILEFNIRAMGNNFHFVHEITDVEPGQRIVAHQRKGPFRAWIHQQSFADAPEGGTTLTNAVQFEPPGGLLGFVVTRKLILEQLDQWIGHGHQLLKRSLENGQS